MPIPSNEQQTYNQLTPNQGVATLQQAQRIRPDGRSPTLGPEIGNTSTRLPCLPHSYFTGKRIAFVAAPYGFGPSSKAIAISSHLPDSIVRDFLGDGPPLELARASREFSTCARLDFSAPADEVSKVLASYRAVVFVNTTRFLAAVSLNASSLVFVDTLAWIRGSWPSPLPQQSAYFAQRFFDYGFSADLEAESSFHAINAIVAKTLTTSKDQIINPKQSPIIHCGGLFSPAMLPGADTAFVTHLCASLNEIRLPVRVVLPKHLHAQFAALAKSGASLIECSPVDVRDHIEGSMFALTTSGIEFTYESAFLGVPMLFLPPFNATQLLQLDYHRRASDICVPFVLEKGRMSTSQTLDTDTALIQEEGMRGVWAKQFAALSRHLKGILSGNFHDTLSALRQQQQLTLAAVGSDGGREIASYIMSELGCFKERVK